MSSQKMKTYSVVIVLVLVSFLLLTQTDWGLGMVNRLSDLDSEPTPFSLALLFGQPCSGNLVYHPTAQLDLYAGYLDEKNCQANLSWSFDLHTARELRDNLRFEPPVPGDWRVYGKDANLISFIPTLPGWNMVTQYRLQLIRPITFTDHVGRRIIPAQEWKIQFPAPRFKVTSKVISVDEMEGRWKISYTLSPNYELDLVALRRVGQVDPGAINVEWDAGPQPTFTLSMKEGEFPKVLHLPSSVFLAKGNGPANLEIPLPPPEPPPAKSVVKTPHPRPNAEPRSSMIFTSWDGEGPLPEYEVPETPIQGPVQYIEGLQEKWKKSSLRKKGYQMSYTLVTTSEESALSFRVSPQGKISALKVDGSTFHPNAKAPGLLIWTMDDLFSKILSVNQKAPNRSECVFSKVTGEFLRCRMRLLELGGRSITILTVKTTAI